MIRSERRDLGAQGGEVEAEEGHPAVGGPHEEDHPPRTRLAAKGRGAGRTWHRSADPNKNSNIIPIRLYEK